MSAYIKYCSQEYDNSAECGPVTSIGRDRGNDIVLSDPQVSRQHALIRRLGKADFYLIDSGSSNGSRLNGRRITTPTQLSDGDRITIGGTSLLFEHQAQPLSFSDSLSMQATMIMDEPVIKEITILVADMRGYTRLSEKLSIQTLTRVMNLWFEQTSEVIANNGGTVDKFIGDCVFARWEGEHHRENIFHALRTACLLGELTSGLYHSFSELSEPLRVGIGINSGMASVEVGSDNTALGDAVNTTFRLESASKALGTDIVLSESVYRVLPLEQWRDKEQSLQLKGKEKGVNVLALGFEQVSRLLQEWD